jgi:hypothetical protein
MRISVAPVAAMAAASLFIASAAAAPTAKPSVKLKGRGVHSEFAATPSPETVFEAIQPCRAFDTHATTPLAANTNRAFAVAGTIGFGFQGGHTGGCGVPTSATAVAISLTTSLASASGTVAAFPFAASVPPPATAAVGFNPSQTQVAGVTVGIGQNKIFLRPTGGSTQATGDITGYYAPQIEAFINADGTIFSSTSRVLSATHDGAGRYSIIVDRDVYYCAVHVTASTGNLIGNGYGNVGNTITVGLDTPDSTLTDVPFNVSAHC